MQTEELNPPMICAPNSDSLSSGKAAAAQLRHKSAASGEASPCPADNQKPVAELLRGLTCLGELMTYLRVQLKVCEGCGGLWFRAQGRAEIYCFSCEGKFRCLPKATKRRRGRPCKNATKLTTAAGGAR